jgi:multidrug efflux pump subunit AcrB
VPLSALASFEGGRAPRSIFRVDGRTTEVVGLKPKDENLKEQTAMLQQVMEDVDLPEGYRWNQSGGLRSFDQDMGELQSAFILAIALVFFLMGLLFESLLLPFSVLFTIPFAVAGAHWSFRLTGTPIDIIGWIGMIVLAGVVVNNGIVLLDRIIHLQRKGMSRDEAIVKGVGDRIRPVMMTALTTIAGLLPIALSEPTGNGFSFKSLAIGVAGGLACTTFFTLWIVPLAYSLLDDLRIRFLGSFRFQGFRRRKVKPAASVA